MDHGRLKKLGVLTALLLNGCLATSCPDVDCRQILRLALQAPQWVTGEYVVTIADSERSFECRFEKGAGDTASVEPCDQISGDPTQSWEAPQLSVHADVSITMQAAKEVSVSVRRDGAMLLDEKLTPTYAKYYPGGPECGACAHTMETLTLPAEEA